MDPIASSEVFEEDPNLNVQELEDGSAIIDLPAEEAAETDFYSNLAETVDTFKLNTVAGHLEDLLEKDQEARKKRDEQYAEGIRRTGLGDDAPGGAQFDGASRVVHPVLAEGCVDFAARTIKELFPANGPVKIKIQGESNTQRLDKAKKKRDYLNWYLTEKLEEYRAEKEILLTQLPLGGSQYEKYWYDPVAGRIRMEFVPVDKVLLPYSAASFYTSPRVTHIQDVTRDEFEGRIASGFYRDIENKLTDQTPEETASEKATDKIEGLTSDDAYNEDGLRRIFEIACWEEFDGEERAPYIIHLDESTGKILAIYRNWAEDDETHAKLDWWVEDKFLPWRGAYGIGLPHLIGGLASALTGALRALLDSAHINNSPGAVKLKGGRASGANTQIAQTEVKEIDAPAGIDDIRKVMMPMPFNPPSPVLFQLLDWITAQAKGVVATAEERIADAGNNMPVGTAMALIEQGSQVFSSIHARLHAAQARGLKIICRLIRTYPDMESLQRFGLTPEDFSDTDGIDPVSDPNIFSESQRFAQYQSAMQLAGQLKSMGVDVNMQILGRRGYELLRMDGIDEFLPKPVEPVTADPVSENVAAANGKPLKANAQQDHLAHAWTHVGYLLNPIHQMNPLPQPYLMAILGHVSEHLNLYYEVTTHAMMQMEMQKAQSQGEQLGQDQLAMRAARAAQQLNAQLLSDLAPLIQQATQIAQQKAPQPPMDPAIKATYDAAMAQIKQKADSDAARLKFEGEKLAEEQRFAQLETQMDQRLAQIEGQNKAHLEVIRMQFEKAAEQNRQQVELMKNDADNKQHQITELLKNRDDNQTQILIEQMKQELSTMMPQATTPQPENDAMLKQLQQMLGELEKSRTNDALSAVTEGLKSMIASQQQHQERTMGLAQQLLQGE